MGEVFSFNATTRGAWLDEIARRDLPLELRVVPHGEARRLASEIVLRVCAGKLIEVRAPDLSMARAMLRVAMAESGRIEVRADEASPVSLASLPSLRKLLQEGEAAARALLGILEPIGGLSSVVVTRSDALVKATPYLSRSALELARLLLDVPRSVAAILSAMPHDDLQTARLLDQLRDVGALQVLPPEERSPAGAASDPARPRVEGPRPSGVPRAGRRSSIPGRGASRAVRRGASLAPHPPRERLEVPELVEEPSAPPRPVSRAPAMASDRPKERPPVPPVAAPTLEREPGVMPGLVEPIELDALEAAGLGRRGARWGLLLAAAAALVAIGIWAARQRSPEPAPDPEPALVIVPIPTTTTATVVQAKPAPPPVAIDAGYSLSNPPPIAGPEADARLREAEALIEAGDYEGAEALLIDLRKQLPRDATVWLLSAHLEVERGRFIEAMRHVNRALEIAPKSYRGYVFKGSIHQFEGRRREAAANYRRALALEPRHPMSPELQVVADQLGAGE